MTTNLEIEPTPTPTRWVQIGFYATSIVFNLCLITQVLTVGVAYFSNPAWWNIHVWLVRGYGGLSLILLGWSFIIPFSPRIRRLAASLPVLLGLQFSSIHFKSPLHLEVLHPLIGFALLYVSSSLVHRVWSSLYDERENPIRLRWGFVVSGSAELAEALSRTDGSESSIESA